MDMKIKGIDVSVYAVRRKYFYMVDDKGQKYRMPKSATPFIPYVGMRLKNVVFSPKTP